MKYNKTQDLLDSFRQMRHQVTTNLDKPKKPSKKQGSNLSAYDKFLIKYYDLENSIDKFKPMDFLYFFREKAQEVEIHYVISNYAKDCKVFKLLLDRYKADEILLMIEFLFMSEQDYLDKTRLRPTILISGWCNTIYQDSLLWVDDKYTNRKKTGKKHSVREFSQNEDDTTTLGGWN